MESYELLMKENAEAKGALANAQKAIEAKEAAYGKLQSTMLKLQADHKALHESNQAEIEGLKRDAARTIFEARLKMVQQVNDPHFNRASWDVAAWKKAVVRLGGEVDAEDARAESSGAGHAGGAGPEVKKAGWMDAGAAGLGDEGNKDKAWAQFLIFIPVIPKLEQCGACC